MTLTVPTKSSLAPREAVRILHSDAAIAVGALDRQAILVWRTEITSYGVAISLRHLADLLKQYPGQRINIFSYIEPVVAFDGSTSTFQACTEALKRLGDAVAASAMVYNREGFWNAAMRGRLTSIFNESNSGIPYALHPTLPEALAWLAEHGAQGIEVSPQALSMAVETLRQS